MTARLALAAALVAAEAHQDVRAAVLRALDVLRVLAGTVEGWGLGLSLAQHGQGAPAAEAAARMAAGARALVGLVLVRAPLAAALLEAALGSPVLAWIGDAGHRRYGLARRDLRAARQVLRALLPRRAARTVDGAGPGVEDLCGRLERRALVASDRELALAALGVRHLACFQPGGDLVWQLASVVDTLVANLHDRLHGVSPSRGFAEECIEGGALLRDLGVALNDATKDGAA